MSTPETEATTAPPEGGFKKRIAARVCEAILATKAGVGHDSENKFSGYTYASVDAVYAHARKAIAEAGLDVRAEITEKEIVPALDAKKTPWLTLTVLIGFESVEGEKEPPVTRYIGTPMTGPQTYGTAMSYVEKYWLRSRLRLSTGDVDADVVEKIEDAAAVPEPTAQDRNAEWTVEVEEDDSLTVTPEPTDAQWRRSQSLQGEVWKAITQAVLRRPRKHERRMLLQAPDIAKAYTFLPKSGRDALDLNIREGE